MSPDASTVRAFLALPGSDAQAAKKRRVGWGIEEPLHQAIELLASEDWGPQLLSFPLKKHRGNATRKLLHLNQLGHKANDAAIVQNARVRAYDMLIELLASYASYIQCTQSRTASALPGS
jgi:hypothetical protein